MCGELIHERAKSAYPIAEGEQWGAEVVREFANGLVQGDVGLVGIHSLSPVG